MPSRQHFLLPPLYLPLPRPESGKSTDPDNIPSHGSAQTRGATKDKSSPDSPCEPSTASVPCPPPWAAERLEMGTFRNSQTRKGRPGTAAVRPARVESGSPGVTAPVGSRGRGLGRGERRRSRVRRLPRRSAGPFRRAAPGAGEAGLGAAAPRRPGRPGAPLHARTAGASPPRAARSTDRTHLTSPTPTPTPSARAEEVAAAPRPGRRPRLRLSPGEPGADGGR